MVQQDQGKTQPEETGQKGGVSQTDRPLLDLVEGPVGQMAARIRASAMAVPKVEKMYAR